MRLLFLYLQMIHEIDQSNVSDADFLLMVTHHYPPLHGEVPTSGPIKGENAESFATIQPCGLDGQNQHI